MLERQREPTQEKPPEMSPEVQAGIGPETTESLEGQVNELRERLDQTENDVALSREQLNDVEAAIRRLRAEADDEEVLGEEEEGEAAPVTSIEKQEEKERKARERREKLVAVTSEALTDKFPDMKFKVLSTEGSSCVVYEGDDGLVYKVGVLIGTKGESYDLGELKQSEGIADRGEYMAREAANLKYLAERGLAPKLIKYMNSEAAADKAPWYKKIFRGRKSQEETAALPILVMEKADFDPDAFKEMSVEEREAEAERITEVLERDGQWAPGDTEPVVDKQTGKIIFIDAGGWLDAKKRNLDIRKRVRSILELD